MKVKQIKGLPESITVGGVEYPIETRNDRNFRVNVTPRAKSRYDYKWVEARNLKDLAAKVLDYQTEQAQKRSKTQKKVDGPLVPALLDGTPVSVRGRHGTTGELLISYHNGVKGKADQSRLTTTDVDRDRISALEAELDRVKGERAALITEFRDVTMELRERDFTVTYHPATGLFSGEFSITPEDPIAGGYGNFIATGPSIWEIEKDIERQVANEVLPFSIEAPSILDPERKLRVVRTRNLEDVKMYGEGYRTKDDADRSLTLYRRREELQDELDAARGKFDYEAELAKVEAAL